MSDGLVLYSAIACNYCHRVRAVLAAKHVPAEVVEFDLVRRPDWYRRKASRGAVPLLEADGRGIHGSAVINEYLEDRFPEPAQLPREPELRAAARMWIAWADVAPAPPRVDPVRLLSAELELTVATTFPKDEGVITVHLFPPEIVEKWSTLAYADVDQASGVLLDSPIVMSYLHERVAKGMKHRFTVPLEAMAGFEEMFNQGSVAFRITLDSEISSNRLTWTDPKLVVRYLGDVDKNNMPPIADAGYHQRVLSGTSGHSGWLGEQRF